MYRKGSTGTWNGYESSLSDSYPFHEHIDSYPFHEHIDSYTQNEIIKLKL